MKTFVVKLVDGREFPVEAKNAKDAISRFQGIAPVSSTREQPKSDHEMLHPKNKSLWHWINGD